MNIALLLLHYKNINDTKKCLDSLAHIHKKSNKVSIILINNDPNCDVQKVFSSSDLIIINNNKNLGFAKGMNRGITYVLKNLNPDFIVLLNNDTLIPQNFISLFESNADIISPVIHFILNGQSVFDYGGIINKWTGRTSHIEFVGKPRSNEKRESIDYVSGCCIAIKKSVLKTIGLLDEQYFFYFEDVDFCVRARDAGFKIAVNPDVIIKHEMSGSIGRWSSKAIYFSLLGNAKFIVGHLGLRIPIGIAYLLLLTVKIIWDKIWNKNQELVS